MSKKPKPGEPQPPWHDDSKPIEERVSLWLGTEGRPTEFKAATYLRNAGFDVQQAVYVPGDKADKSLEMDAVARLGAGDSVLELLVECKFANRANGTTWVAIANEQKPDLHPFDCLGLTAVCREILYTTPKAKIDPIRDMLDWTSPPAFSLERMTKAGKEDGGFDTITIMLTRSQLRLDQHDAQDVAALLIPVLVIEGELVTAQWHTDANKFTATKTDSARLLWGGNTRWKAPGALIEIVTLDGLKAFAERMKLLAAAWFSVADEQVPEAQRAARGSRAAAENASNYEDFQQWAREK